MKKITFWGFITFLFFCYANSLAEEKNVNEINETELNIYTGMFDFSDQNKKLVFWVYSIKMKIYLETVF